MIFDPPLTKATLIKRYKRFLADVTLENGEIITVHCPNTGSMKACWDEGWTAYLEDSDNPKRKYRHTWTLSVNTAGEFIGVNTHLANKLVEEAIRAHSIKELYPFNELKREVKYGNENSRIDFLLATDKQPIYIEVKNVTLKEKDGKGYFPDAESIRGQKHLRELTELAKSGEARAVLLFCVQHSGIQEVSAAKHIDPKYTQLLNEAAEQGVEILAYGATLSPEEIRLDRKLIVSY